MCFKSYSAKESFPYFHQKSWFSNKYWYFEFRERYNFLNRTGYSYARVPIFRTRAYEYPSQRIFVRARTKIILIYIKNNRTRHFFKIFY